MANFGLTSALASLQATSKNLSNQILRSQFQLIEMVDGAAAISTLTYGTLISRDAKSPSNTTHVLGNGKYDGQLKMVRHDGAGNSIWADIIPTNMKGGTKIRLEVDSDNNNSCALLMFFKELFPNYNTN